MEISFIGHLRDMRSQTDQRCSGFLLVVRGPIPAGGNKPPIIATALEQRHRRFHPPPETGLACARVDLTLLHNELH